MLTLVVVASIYIALVEVASVVDTLVVGAKVPSAGIVQACTDRVQIESSTSLPELVVVTCAVL